MLIFTADNCSAGLTLQARQLLSIPVRPLRFDTSKQTSFRPLTVAIVAAGLCVLHLFAVGRRAAPRPLLPITHMPRTPPTGIKSRVSH